MMDWVANAPDGCRGSGGRCEHRGRGPRVLHQPPGGGAHRTGRHLQVRQKTIPISSVPDSWHFGVDPDPALSLIDLLDANIKLNLKKVFLLTFAWFYKDKKSKRSHKTVGIKVFLTIFACWYHDRRIRIRNTGRKLYLLCRGVLSVNLFIDLSL